MIKLILATTLLLFSLPSWSMEYDTDRPGQDYESFDLAASDPALCENACNGQTRCVAWTYVKPGVQGPHPRCWLKHTVPAAVHNECCVSGVKANRTFRSRWDKIGGPGGAWSTGWVPNVQRQICGHFATGCNCNGYNYCGEYPHGAETYWWPNGCDQAAWKIRCTSEPQFSLHNAEKSSRRIPVKTLR
jgi:hypothetical protein